MTFLTKLLLVVPMLGHACTAIRGNFTSSCSNLVLHKGVVSNLSLLTASCMVEDAAHSIRNSTLDLNLCLGIEQTTGALVWSIYGKYSEYCDACATIGRTTLECSCKTMNGIKNNSTIDLDAGIVNFNGSLACSQNVPS